MSIANIVPKSTFESLVKQLAQEIDVVAPVKREGGKFSFERVSGTSSLEEDDYIPTLNPPKKHFFPSEEPLFRFTSTSKEAVHSGSDVEVNATIETQERILLAVRPCDIRAIKLMDQVFEDEYEDDNYLAKREKATIIGLNCLKPCDENAFCAAMGSLYIEEGYDLLLTDLGDRFYVDVGTDKGSKLIDRMPEARKVTEEHEKKISEIFKQRDEEFADCANKLDVNAEDLPELLDTAKSSPVWERYGELCLGCGRCNMVCPTCFCFDVQDEVSLHLDEGERKRKWDACTLLEFALVAGGENFREERSERLRHMFYHKSKYGPDRYGDLYCTGCGRCLRTCLVNINPVEVYNEVHEQPGGETE